MRPTDEDNMGTMMEVFKQSGKRLEVWRRFVSQVGRVSFR